MGARDGLEIRPEGSVGGSQFSQLLGFFLALGGDLIYPWDRFLLLGFLSVCRSVPDGHDGSLRRFDRQALFSEPDVDCLVVISAQRNHVFQPFGPEPFVGVVVKLDGWRGAHRAQLRPGGHAVGVLEVLPVLAGEVARVGLEPEILETFFELHPNPRRNCLVARVGVG